MDNPTPNPEWEKRLLHRKMLEDRTGLETYHAIGERFSGKTTIRDVSPKPQQQTFIFMGDEGAPFSHDFEVTLEDGLIKLGEGLYSVIDHEWITYAGGSLGSPVIGDRHVYIQYTYSTAEAEGSWMFAYGTLPNHSRSVRVFPIAKVTASQVDDVITVSVRYCRIGAVEVLDIRDCP